MFDKSVSHIFETCLSGRRLFGQEFLSLFTLRSQSKDDSYTELALFSAWLMFFQVELFQDSPTIHPFGTRHMHFESRFQLDDFNCMKCLFQPTVFE